MTAITVTDDSFQAEVLESERPVVVDFWAAWCGPCRVMSPILEELAAERADLRVVKVDVDANQAVAAQLRRPVDADLHGLPRRRARSGRSSASRPKKRLVADLDALL